jgi:TPR repeat protein
MSPSPSRHARHLRPTAGIVRACAGHDLTARVSLQVYHRACTDTDKPVLDACFNLGVMTKQGARLSPPALSARARVRLILVSRAALAVSYFKRACDSGMQEACQYASPDIASDKPADDKVAPGGVHQHEKGRESSQT